MANSRKLPKNVKSASRSRADLQMLTAKSRKWPFGGSKRRGCLSPSLRFDIGRFDDRPPLVNLSVLEIVRALLATADAAGRCPARDGPGVSVSLIGEGLAQSFIEPGDNRIRPSLW